MDCSSYSACFIPVSSGITCIYNGSLWTTNYYVSGYPDNASYSGAWAYHGVCDSSLSSSSNSVDSTTVDSLNALNGNIEALTYLLLVIFLLGCFAFGVKFFR